MSERIKNFKYFKYTLICVLVLGMFLTIYHMRNDLSSSTNVYKKNKDNYEYNIDISYDKITHERIIAGEEIYLNEDEYSLYKKTIPLVFAKKINRLAILETGIKEADEFYEAKYSENNNVTNEPSRYKTIKTELVNKYLKENLSDKKYLTTSNTYLLDSKDGFDYIKEIIYFVDTKEFKIHKMIEINSKYNYKKDIIEYADINEIDNEHIEKINGLISESLLVYNQINSKKNDIVDDILKKDNIKVDKLYIFNRTTVIGNSKDNKTIKYDFLKK